MSIRLFFPPLAALAIMLGLAACGGGTAAPREPVAGGTEHFVPDGAPARAVHVSRTMPMPSPERDHLTAMLESGRMPAHVVRAEVLTDSECTPDAEGISRCRNEVRLPDGRTIVLRHPHNMQVVPCLSPGELVRLVPG